MQNNRVNTTYDLVTLQGKMTLASKVEIIDISLGGVALKADRQLDLNREYMIKFGDVEHRINVKGTVVRSSINERDTSAYGEQVRTYAVGMKFLDNQTDKIAAFLATVELRKQDEVSSAAERRLHVRYQIIPPQNKVPLFPDNFKMKDISPSRMSIQPDHPDGAFSEGWTHVVDTPNGTLWYNAQTGAGVIGRIDGAGNQTSFKSYPAASFSTDWTHIVVIPKGIFWYNAQTGAGLIGRLDSAGNHDNIKVYPAGSFSTGWTHIINTPNGILWYNAKTGASVIGWID